MPEHRKKTNIVKPWLKRRGANSPLPPSHCSTQSGFTIIESLMALLVAGVLLTAMAPFFVMAVGGRVQARRVDLATQAARSYIDGVRAGVLPPPDKAPDFSGVLAPATVPVDPKNSVDTNGNGFSDGDSNDLVIQAFRSGDQDAEIAKEQGYCLGVRVYRADAFNGGSPDKVVPSSSGFTGGLGNKSQPLVVMRTEIINQTSFSDYQSRFLTDPSDPSSTQPNQCQA